MREGPEITTTRSCFGCKWLESEYYRCQGDSGHDYRCKHPTVVEKPQHERYIGDCRTVTPDWCPVLRSPQVDEVRS